MNRQEKEQVIERLKQGLDASKASFLVNYCGLSVAQMQQLRRGVRGGQGQLIVAKARLMRIAMQSQAHSSFGPYLRDQIALVVGQDSTAMAKILHGYTKESRLKIVAGLTGDQFLDAQNISRIAMLPSRDVLLAEICGLFVSPLSGLARGLEQLRLKRAEETEK